MLTLCCPFPPQHPSTRFANTAPTALPRVQTSTGTEAISRHRSIRVPSFVTIRTRGGLGAGATNSKRSAEDAPLGLGRRRASGKEYPDDRGAKLPGELVGHQGGDVATFVESVRCLDPYKKRGESTAFLTSPPSSPLLYFPSLLLHSSLPSLILYTLYSSLCALAPYASSESLDGALHFGFRGSMLSAFRRLPVHYLSGASYFH